jgi:SAM-dependent methyltransferase
VDPKQLVADGYDRLHTVYAEWAPAGPHDLRRRYIDRAIELAEPAPRDVLDLGCGTGRHGTAHLVAKGLAVTGVDISARSIEVARREISEADFRVADMASVELPAESFDLVTALYSLIHVPREEHHTVLDRINSWLRPGGHLVVTMGGDHPPDAAVIDPAWLGIAPMYWSTWDAITSRRLIRQAGCDEVDAHLETVDEHGRDVVFLWVIARKPGGRAGGSTAWAPP